MEKAYQYWRDPRKIPDFVSSIEKVVTAGQGGDRWCVHGACGEVSELEAREASSRRGISWKTVGDPCGGGVSVTFEELWPERTRINVEDSHSLPECAIVKDGDLERFRSVVENEELLELKRDEGMVRRDLISASLGSLAAFGVCALILALRRMRRAGYV